MSQRVLLFKSLGIKSITLFPNDIFYSFYIVFLLPKRLHMVYMLIFLSFKNKHKNEQHTSITYYQINIQI